MALAATYARSYLVHKAMQVAPHVCSDPPGRHVAQCDPGGAASNSFLADQEGLCPNDGCIIDTRRPFRHHQTFVADGATLVAIENRLEQIKHSIKNSKKAPASTLSFGQKHNSGNLNAPSGATNSIQNLED